MISNFVKAIELIRPNAKWYTLDNSRTYESIIWDDENINKPTKEEFENALLYIQNLEYREKRALEYPPIGDQLDALFHAGIFPEEMATKIQNVKDKYPKP